MYALAVLGLAAALSPAESAHDLIEDYGWCFTRCHAKTGDRGATLVLDVTFGPDGRPSAIVVSGLAPPEAECVRVMARKLLFEPPTRVIHHFLLEAADARYGAAGGYGFTCECETCDLPPFSPSRYVKAEPLRIGRFQVVGETIDHDWHDWLRRFVRLQRQKIVACWDGQSAGVELDVSFRLLAEGRVTAAEVAGAPSPLAQCVKAAVAGMKFPGGHRGVLEVRVPITVGTIAP